MFVRSALILRKQELQEALAAAPADIAIKREKWFSSERPADERSLHKAKVAMQAMEDELLEVNAGIGIVDRLLAEELAKQQAEAQAKLEARLGELRVGQADAFRVCGEKLADLFAAWQVFAATQEALHTTWLTSPDRDGVGPGHLLDPAPVTFEAMLGVLYRVSLRRDVGYQPLGPVLDLVPDLGADTRLEIGGHGVQPSSQF